MEKSCSDCAWSLFWFKSLTSVEAKFIVACWHRLARQCDISWWRVVIIRTVHTSLHTSHLRLKGSRPNASLSVLLDHRRKICPLLYVVFQGFMFYAVTTDTAPGASAALKPRYRSPYHTAVKPLLAVGPAPDFGWALWALMVLFRLVRGPVLHFLQRTYTCFHTILRRSIDYFYKLH